ncbi:MAG: transketolase family protein [Spirochaetales bacterium]|jgi:transketolase|nr:transketolase family protein [Spirochaetales bacterium]
MKDIHSYKDMRGVYADTLVDLAEKDERVVVLEADLMSASGTKVFKNKFPERLINAGVAEANMVCVASGLSSQGFIPFANTFGCFATRRAYDQFFLSANYAKQNVKLVGTDPGVTAKFNGGTHMPFCDIALTRVIPDLVVMEPADTVSVHKLTKLAYEHQGCIYMRLHRKGAVNIYPVDQKFEIGKGIVNREGTDAAIFATGMVMLPEALKAADMLKKEGISAAVIDMHTVKPLDKELVLEYAKKTGALVTCENGQIAGGLGGAVTEYLSETCPTIVRRVGVQDLFGEVGTQEYLQERFKLTAEEIVIQVKKAIELKK